MRVPDLFDIMAFSCIGLDVNASWLTDRAWRTDRYWTASNRGWWCRWDNAVAVVRCQSPGRCGSRWTRLGWSLRVNCRMRSASDDPDTAETPTSTCDIRHWSVKQQHKCSKFQAELIAFAAQACPRIPTHFSERGLSVCHLSRSFTQKSKSLTQNRPRPT